MTRNILIVAAIVAAVVAGVFVGRHLSVDGSSMDGTTASDEREILYWVAPMDPNFRLDDFGFRVVASSFSSGL